MKFRDKRDGALLEPASEKVAAMMAANPNLEAVDEKPAKQPRRAAKTKE